MSVSSGELIEENSNAHRLLQIYRGEMTNLEVRIWISTISGNKCNYSLQEWIHMVLDRDLDNRAHSLGEADKVRKLLLQADDYFDTLYQNGFDLSLSS